MDSRAERAARNESLFREVNERITETSLGSTESSRAVCECQITDCLETLEVTLEEYEVVRKEGDRFILVEGHDDPEIERVVDRTDRFIVVEKIGEAGQVARDLDPRS
ncbi:MAG: hypothetical protein H0V79_04160 [Actinobacteria bacterium]|nr:hypothetical protein [Actinomycetota bacterium]